MGKRVRKRELNKIYNSTRKDKKKMVFVLNPKTKRVNVVHFGQRGYCHDHSPQARERYLKRSAGIRDGKGRLTKNNKLSANYWARKVLWGAK